ncbi:MAG: class I SAM-dependent methyltransferase [Acidimicrobiales bacterium]
MLVADLLARADVNGEGRLLDLACGTGQITFALRGSFDDIWAVDQEPDMIRVGREKAAHLGVRNIQFVTSAAEDLIAPEESFDLVAIGNAFHRLPRETVALDAFRRLGPGRYLALLWSETPWSGDAPWQRAMAATVDRWMTRVEAHGRIPPGYEQARAERPDTAVLQEAGFQVIGFYEFPTVHLWTREALIGFVYSTSVLPYEILGDLAGDFEEDLGRVLTSLDPGGQFTQTVRFAYQLARRPA